MLDGSLAGPGAQGALGLAGLGLPSGEGEESPASHGRCGGRLFGHEAQFHPVAGGQVAQLLCTHGVRHGGQAFRAPLARQGEARDGLFPSVAPVEADDSDAIHGSMVGLPRTF